MKRITPGLIALILLLPAFSFAQITPQAPASWVAFQKEENTKRTAFNNQMKTEMEDFLNSHPDVKAYFQEVKAANKARIEAWKSAHQK